MKRNVKGDVKSDPKLSAHKRRRLERQEAREARAEAASAKGKGKK